MKAPREWMCHDLVRKPVLISGVWAGRGWGVFTCVYCIPIPEHLYRHSLSK
jgi:hypothetical protein